tara:strand:- start:512 stop:883 length:372 start_codon:yes stop_codon:yes gene_type:complete
MTNSNEEKRFGELDSSEREDAEHDILSIPELGKDGVNDIMGDFFTDQIINYLTVSQIKGLIKIKLKEETKPQVVDCYELLTPDQRKQVSNMVLEALIENDIHPEIWEMKLEAIIDSEQCGEKK